MRTVPFRSVLWKLARKAGLDPATNLMADQAATFTDSINTQVRKAWRAYKWPELCPVEQRTADADRVIALAQEDETEIGEGLALFSRDPRATRAAGRLSPMRLVPEGILLPSDAPATVWLQFRLPVPEFTSELWQSGAYEVGQLVYYAGDGEVYRCAEAVTNEEPGDSDKWVKVDFPFILETAVVLAAYADFLEEDGQSEKASVQEAKALAALDQEIEIIEKQQGQTPRFNVKTP